ncbi:MAG: nickel pincer cofactor biosynthesis protein LarC [Mycobacteriales bacterium]
MIGWVDCGAGASGDMFLGAVVDAGAPVEALRDAIAAVGVERIRLEITTVSRHSIGATKVDVVVPRTTVSRTWANIRDRLETSELTDWVKTTALSAFRRLAEAEAAVHRTTPEHVHFHEVGGLDAIADVVGTAAGLHALGVRELHAGTVALGTGMVRGEHGLVPVPAPAVLYLLREADAPVWAGPAPYEMCTPTGAALLAATVSTWGVMPPMTVRAVGVGAGSREVDEVPNLLRLVLGDAPEPAEPAGPGSQQVIEANVDDLDPRLWPGVLDQLLAAGAVDAWLSPVTMKKGRPAHTVHALCPTAAAAAVRDVLFAATTTIGVREYTVDKHALHRERATVTVLGHPVGVKIAHHGGRPVNVSVEYDDVWAVSEATGVPVKDVLRAATAIAHDRHGRTGAP